MFKLGLKFITPVLQVMLSYNRLHKVPKNELQETLARLQIFFTAEIMIPGIAPLFAWANLHHQPIPDIYIFGSMLIYFLIGCVFIYSLKRRNIVETFIKESDAMTREQHHARRKSLVLKFILWYISPIIALVVFCVLFQEIHRYYSH